MRRSYKAYVYVLATSIFFLSVRSFAQLNNAASSAESARCVVCRMGLASQLAYLWGTPDCRSAEGHEIYVLDSEIVPRDLPQLPSGKILALTLAAIDSIARVQGKVQYSHLVSVNLDSGKAEVVWQRMTAFYNRKLGEVNHCVGRTDKLEYVMTAKGWGEVGQTTTIYALDEP